MSAETKKAAEITKENLGNAGEYLRRAAENAGKTGDKTLIEKVTKIKQETEEATKELTKKLKEG
ncbi:MAG TPA: hypothetical protein VII94_03355 [Candidatus Saccharimonadales bacterium]